MVEEKEHESSEHHEHHKKFSITNKLRENPWRFATLICGLLILVLLFGVFSGGLTGNVSKNKAADNLVSYAQSQGIDVVVNGVKEEAGLYSLDVEIQGSPTTLYLTKDGRNIVNGLIPILITASDSSDVETQEIPKTEKPGVELYVFTYCPYGLQMEKAMIPVAKLLGDNIDFKIRQIGAMHGEAEKTEAKRQLCIEKNYPDKFLDYVLAFAEDTSCQSGDDSCITTKVNSLYSKLGIVASKVNSCMTSEGDDLYEEEVSNANSKGISGSPTLVINGVETQSSRSEEAVKGIICESFSNVPSKCAQTLSASQASPGFGSGTSTSSSSSSAQC